MIRAAVLGSPISHSLSPALHKKAYEILGLQGEFEAIEVKAGELGTFLEDKDSSWTGFSLTMPLKEEVMAIANEFSEIAIQVASANTLTRGRFGWQVTSTDVNGFVQSLLQHGYSTFQSAVIIGAGATARAAAAACEKFTSAIFVIHRSPARELLMRAAAPNTEMHFLDWNDDLPLADLIINTTPAGVADQFEDRVHLPTVFFEALYNPWPTALLSSLRKQGVIGIDGLDLLIHQGIDQLELMSGLDVSRALLAPELRSTCLKAMKK